MPPFNQHNINPISPQSPSSTYTTSMSNKGATTSSGKGKHHIIKIMPPFNQHNINPISPHLQHRLPVCHTKGQQHHRVRGMDNNHRTRIHLPLPSLISKIKAIFRQVRYIPNGQVRQNTVLPVRKWQRATPDEWQRGKPENGSEQQCENGRCEDAN
ncbi:Uncharacterized protein Fot_02521 [Forsythia ovata]|uniref:Uncharacterized protein n=1 Tax=Forsythia ovata TaxID=205694 RepID=A0ABD1X742_9LAMI